MVYVWSGTVILLLPGPGDLCPALQPTNKESAVKQPCLLTRIPRRSVDQSTYLLVVSNVVGHKLANSNLPEFHGRLSQPHPSSLRARSSPGIVSAQWLD